MENQLRTLESTIARTNTNIFLKNIYIYFFFQEIFHIHSLKKYKSIKLLHHRVKAMRLLCYKDKYKNLTIKSYL